eukprot:2988319-Amphidinium_carterae.4
MAHGDTIPMHLVISSSRGEKSDDEHVPRGNTSVGESSVKVDPATRDISRPASLDRTRNSGMDELNVQALRVATLTSAKAVDMVNGMVCDRLSCVKDAQSVLHNSEEFVARATSRKREEQGALPEGQTKHPRVEIDDGL